MSKYTRRDFVKVTGAATASLISASWPLGVLAKAGSAKSRVVVIGGGYGGATCAKYIRKLAPGVEVTLVEQNKQFITCPFSNTVIGGLDGLNGFTHLIFAECKIIGPLLMGVVALATGSTRISILSILILFISGAILLYFVSSTNKAVTTK